MKDLFKSDYVIYDRILDNVIRFTNNDIVVYGGMAEAVNDSRGNEVVISSIDLPIRYKEELIKQINKY